MAVRGDDPQLIGHWPLDGDLRDHAQHALATRAIDVETGARGRVAGRSAARFNGRSSLLEVAGHAALQLGRGEFTVSAWVNSDADVVGDLVSRFDDDRRKGFHLGVRTNSGVTSTATSNYRHLQFGIDDAQLDTSWRDCGRPGNAVKIAALCASNGRLYAGTLETGPRESGKLFVYEGDDCWRALGNPLGCNIVHAVAEFDGALYAGTGRYNCHGSVLGDTQNRTPGGKVYRVEPGGRWIDCGHPGHEDAVPDAVPTTAYETGKADDVFALCVWRDRLYCTSNHRRGVFQYVGGTTWRRVGLDRRVISLTVWRDALYALINGGPVFRYDGGDEWTDCGCPAGSTQTYSAVIQRDRFHVGTWPEGGVHVYEGGQAWRELARIAYEREIMATANYNGKAYVGGLPMANVYRLDGTGWAFVGNLDSSPVVLRRVWSMAVFQGRLFAGTLPAGRVCSIEAGRMATADSTFARGWHHVAAVRRSAALELCVDGRVVAVSSEFGAARFDLHCDQPLQIGFGPFAHFSGSLSDVRIHGRALAESELRELARP